MGRACLRLPGFVTDGKQSWVELSQDACPFPQGRAVWVGEDWLSPA